MQLKVKTKLKVPVPKKKVVEKESSDHYERPPVPFRYRALFFNSKG